MSLPFEKDRLLDEGMNGLVKIGKARGARIKFLHTLGWKKSQRRINVVCWSLKITLTPFCSG